MATTNPTAYRLTIALIVFVLLTFILTITTYLFFKQRTDEQASGQWADGVRASRARRPGARQSALGGMRPP